MTVVYLLLVAHFVADFMCQSDWMALNKSKSWHALTWHIVTYTAVLGLCLLIWHPGPWLLIYLGVNGAVHFTQDALTSRLTSRLWFLPQVGHGMRPNWIQVEFRETRHWFFVAIGFDQLLHYVTLFVTAGWWLQ